MLEIHPFGVFVPLNAQHLVLGSFTGKLEDPSYDWFYSNKRNQFWPILSQVYKAKLETKEQKQQLFTKLKMAMADIILSCKRQANSNLDVNLTNITFNTQEIITIFKDCKIQTTFFTSRFVEKLFRRHFKDSILSSYEVELITLPSPSPRYVLMTKEQKIKKYTELLPKLA